MIKLMRLTPLLLLMTLYSCNNKIPVRPTETNVVAIVTNDIEIIENEEFFMELYNTIMGNRQYIYYIDFAPDGTNMVTGCADSTVRIWDFRSGEELYKIKENYDEIWGIPVRYTPDGQYIIYGAYNVLKCAVVSNEYERISSVRVNKNGIQSLEVSPDGQYVLTVGVEGNLSMWSIPDLELVTNVVGAHTSEIWNISISSDGKYAITGGEDTTAKIWGLPELELIEEIDYHNYPIEYTRITEDGEYILLGSSDGTISIWDFDKYISPKEVLTGHIGAVLVAIFSNDGEYVFSGGDDDDIYVYSVDSGEIVKQISEHFGDIMALEISPDGMFLASGSRDRTVKIWLLTEY